MAAGRDIRAVTVGRLPRRRALHRGWVTVGGSTPPRSRLRPATRPLPPSPFPLPSSPFPSPSADPSTHREVDDEGITAVAVRERASPQVRYLPAHSRAAGLMRTSVPAGRAGAPASSPARRCRWGRGAGPRPRPGRAVPVAPRARTPPAGRSGGAVAEAGPLRPEACRRGGGQHGNSLEGKDGSGHHGSHRPGHGPTVRVVGDGWCEWSVAGGQWRVVSSGRSVTGRQRWDGAGVPRPQTPRPAPRAPHPVPGAPSPPSPSSWTSRKPC